MERRKNKDTWELKPCLYFITLVLWRNNLLKLKEPPITGCTLTTGVFQLLIYSLSAPNPPFTALLVMLELDPGDASSARYPAMPGFVREGGRALPEQDRRRLLFWVLAPFLSSCSCSTEDLLWRSPGSVQHELPGGSQEALETQPTSQLDPKGAHSVYQHLTASGGLQPDSH